MEKIKLTQGYVSLVDDEDFERVSQHNWSVAHRDSVTYAQARIKDRWVYLHRFILSARRGEVVDHRDHDGLNNQRANLRLCSHAQNSRNARRRAGCTSAYRGVVKPAASRCQAYISAGGRCVYLGSFDDEEDAARTYDAAAHFIDPEFALLNFANEDNSDRLNSRLIEKLRAATSVLELDDTEVAVGTAGCDGGDKLLRSIYEEQTGNLVTDKGDRKLGRDVVTALEVIVRGIVVPQDRMDISEAMQKRIASALAQSTEFPALICNEIQVAG